MIMENVSMENVNAIHSLLVLHVNREDVRMTAWIEENAQVIINASVILVLVAKIVVKNYVLIIVHTEANVVIKDVCVRMDSLVKTAHCYLVPTNAVEMVSVIFLQVNVNAKKVLRKKIVPEKFANSIVLITENVLIMNVFVISDSKALIAKKVK
jgi:hypothetical protein